MLAKQKNNYNTMFDDDSFMIVDKYYKLLLFNKSNYQDNIQLDVDSYISHIDNYTEYIMLDKINDNLLPTEFKIKSISNDKNLPLEIRFMEEINETI